MPRKLKILGLSSIAALLVSVSVASVASAQFDSEAEVTSLHGEQSTTIQLTFQAGTLTCSVATFTGTQTGTWNGTSFTSPDVTVDPTYENCVGLGELHINMNGCQYTLTAGGTLEAGTRVAGKLQIVCPAGKQIEITGTGFAGLCRIAVPVQTPTGSKLTYHNVGSGSSREVVVESEVTGIHYTQHGAFCPGNGFNSTRSFTNGTYTGDTLTGGSSGGTPVGISVT